MLFNHILYRQTVLDVEIIPWTCVHSQQDSVAPNAPLYLRKVFSSQCWSDLQTSYGFLIFVRQRVNVLYIITSALDE